MYLIGPLGSRYVLNNVMFCFISDNMCMRPKVNDACWSATVVSQSFFFKPSHLKIFDEIQTATLRWQHVVWSQIIEQALHPRLLGFICTVVGKLSGWWATIACQQRGPTRSRWKECFGDSLHWRKKKIHIMGYRLWLRLRLNIIIDPLGWLLHLQNMQKTNFNVNF